MAVQFKVEDGKLVKVVEAETTEAELRAELQLAADEAQNRHNSAVEAQAQAQANLKAANEAAETADAEVEAAGVEVGFSVARLTELNEAVAVLGQVDESTATEESSGDAPADEPDPDTAVDETAEATESEAVEVPVHIADEAPA